MKKNNTKPSTATGKTADIERMWYEWYKAA